MVSFKICNDSTNTFLRISIEGNQIYKDLVEYIEESLSITLLKTGQNSEEKSSLKVDDLYRLLWVDDEQDVCSINSPMDLEEAVNVSGDKVVISVVKNSYEQHDKNAPIKENFGWKHQDKPCKKLCSKFSKCKKDQKKYCDKQNSLAFLLAMTIPWVLLHLAFVGGVGAFFFIPVYGKATWYSWLAMKSPVIKFIFFVGFGICSLTERMNKSLEEVFTRLGYAKKQDSKLDAKAASSQDPKEEKPVKVDE